jgi:hypothetical protein
VLEPVAFLRRLAALVPPMRQNQGRYHGLLAAQARRRDRLLALVATAGDDQAGDDLTVDAAAEPSTEPEPAAGAAGHRIRWARLLARVFGHQVLTW